MDFANFPLNYIVLAYLVASVFFIQALKGLSHPTTSIKGNTFGMTGMAIAFFATCVLILKTAAHLNVDGITGLGYVLGALVLGGGVGAVMAKKVEMTKMPELVAFMHSMIGLAAVFIAVAAAVEPWAFGITAKAGAIPYGNRLELALGAAIGAITFSGSVIAFGKLSGKYKFRLFQGAPVQFKGQHLLNLVLGLATLFFIVGYTISEARIDFWLLLALAFVLGVLIIIPIGGADMPVVVSMLNSYSGWAAAGIGFSLNNSMLIIAGSLVGSSGAILSYIMCKAMNRSFFNVILGGFGGEASTAAAGGAVQRTVKSGSADDAAFVLSNAETVVIVPGYGLAVARAQHAVKELAAKLTEKGITVKYAIHPVAGRMPGHMNVLLAEADVPYDKLVELEDINPDLPQTDVVVVIDSPDFTHRVARAIKKRDPSIKTVDYVAPQVWASRAYRAKAMAHYFDLVLALFPFEVPIYQKAGVPVTFVGHPLADDVPAVPDQEAARDQIRLPMSAPVFALLPGSRRGELEQHAELVIETAKRVLAQVPDARFLVPLATRPTRSQFEQALYDFKGQDLPMTVLFGHAQLAMIAADVVLVASGTATLEAALLRRPMVITYRVPKLTYRLMWPKRLLPYIGLPNVLAGGFVAPELAAQAGLPVAADGRVRVDGSLRVPGHPEVLVVGDAARVLQADGSALRMACATAMPMGAHAAEQVLRQHRGEAASELRFAAAMLCVSLGRGEGLIQLLTAEDRPRARVVRGRAAAVIKEAICRMTVVALRAEARGVPVYRWLQPGPAPALPAAALHS